MRQRTVFEIEPRNDRGRSVASLRATASRCYPSEWRDCKGEPAGIVGERGAHRMFEKLAVGVVVGVIVAVVHRLLTREHAEKDAHGDVARPVFVEIHTCLLYTSDAADE